MKSRQPVFVTLLGVSGLVLLGLAGLALAQKGNGNGNGNANAVSSLPMGGSLSGAPQQVIMANLPQATPTQLQAHPRGMRPQNGASDADWNSRGKHSGERHGPNGLGGATLGGAPQLPSAAETPSTGVSFAGSNETNCFCWPSDMAIAAGAYLKPPFPPGTAGYLVQATNTTIEILRKDTGAELSGYPKSFNAFLGLPASAFTFDPRAFYDVAYDRFVITIDFNNCSNGSCTFSGGAFSRTYVAASQTGDPTGAWFVYGFQPFAAGECEDFPTLGHDHQPGPATTLTNFNGAIYVGANIFGCNTTGFTNFVDNMVMIIYKNQVYHGAGANSWVQHGFNLGGTLIDTLQPANVFSPADNPRVEFLVNSRNINFGGGQCFNGCNGLTVWAVSNVSAWIGGGQGPVFSAIDKGTPFNYFESLGASQPGGTLDIDTGDTRISGAVQYIAGTLVGTLTTSILADSPEASTPEFFEIRDITLSDNGGNCTSTNCATITAYSFGQYQCYQAGGTVCSGTPFSTFGSGGSAYYGTIQPDLERNWTMGFAFSNTGTFPGIAYSSRRVNFTPNLFHDGGFFLAAGQAFYSLGRWGDYTGVSVDIFDPNPSNTGMWFSGMYANAAGTWNTQIGMNSFKQNPAIP